MACPRQICGGGTERDVRGHPNLIVGRVAVRRMPSALSLAAERTIVCGLQSLAAPSQVSRKNICECEPCCPVDAPVNATKRPSKLTAGVSSQRLLKLALAAAACEAAGQKFAFVDTVNVMPFGLVPPPPSGRY